MKILLDTHAFLWWVLDDPKLPASARGLVADEENTILFSVASAWEMSIKVGLGRLTFPQPAAPFVSEQIRINGFQLLPISLTHSFHTAELPHHHRDPFDRMLIAQSRVEQVPILSRDSAFEDYDVTVLW